MTGWWALAFVVLWLLVVVLCIVVIALARQVGTPAPAARPAGRPRDRRRGTRPRRTAARALGARRRRGGRARRPADLRLVLFASATCAVCREVSPGVPAAAAAGRLEPGRSRCGGRAGPRCPRDPVRRGARRAGDRAREGYREQPRAGRRARGHRQPTDLGGPRTVGKLTSIERAERSLATRTSRRSFLGRVGRGVVALAGGGLVATAIAPDRAQAASAGTPIRRVPAPIPTRRCRGPIATATRCTRSTDTRSTTRGRSTSIRGARRAARHVNRSCPRRIHSPGRHGTGAGGPGAARAGCATSRTVAPGRTSASTGLRGAWVLSSSAEGLLHLLPGAQQDVLTDPFGGDALAASLLLVLVAASAIAGWSALYGP